MLSQRLPHRSLFASPGAGWKMRQGGQSMTWRRGMNDVCEYDYSAFYRLMAKPARIFDGRLLLDHKRLTQIGYIVEAIGIACENLTMNGYST
ncbi:unnamed protein product [Trichobilharzia regenti]|nr:unnamed protein product [Trichobilharzia regenti]